MKHISWLKFWLLGYVTFGIYPIVCWCRLTKQQNKMAKSINGKTILGFIASWLLGCVTFGIVPIVWIFQFCKQQITLAEAKGVRLVTHNTFLLFILLCVPIYSFVVLCGNHNKLVDAYTAKEPEVIEENV